MRTTAQVSPQAMRHLDLWVPRMLREEAWRLAYDVYIRRATTTDNEERTYASDRADRFWPIYIPANPPTE